MSSYSEHGNRWFVHYVSMVNRGDNGVDKPWLGFCYGSWLPRVRIARHDFYAGVSFRWLCFFGEFGTGRLPEGAFAD